jgi:hypothetical protein
MLYCNLLEEKSGFPAKGDRFDLIPKWPMTFNSPFIFYQYFDVTMTRMTE